MTIDDVLKLVNAGFTAEQITAMIAQAPAAAQPEEVNNPTITDNPPEDPPTDPEPTAAPEPDLLGMIDKKFDDLMTSIKGQLAPSIADIKPLGIEDIITKFFKED